MSETRRTRAWWKKTVEQWRRSGLSAPVFARRHAISGKTLRWWSWNLSRVTRAEHGPTTDIVPIEIALPTPSPQATDTTGTIEVAAAGVAIRCEVGTDVGYVAALVRAFEGR